MARRRGDHELRRTEIAAAAYSVILASGIEQTRLKEIAAQLGFSTGVIQHYFNDKEELLLFAKNHLFDTAFKQMLAAAEKADGIERLHALAREILPLNRKRIEMFQLLAAFRGRAIGQPKLMELQRRRDELGWSLFAAEILALQRQGLINTKLNAKDEAIGLVAYVEGLATQIIMGGRQLKKETTLELLENYITNTFGANSPP
jgi:AcrR family transcriptional regulator